MKKHIIYFIIIFLLNISCKNKKDSIILDNQLNVDYNFEFKNNIFNIIKDVEIFQLNNENINNFVFNKISKIVTYDNKFYLKSNKNEIYKTTNTGNFIKVLYKQGIAPNEYREIKDFAINSKEELYVYDFQKQRFLIYDLDFRYLRTENIGFNFMNFEFIKNGNLALFTAKHRNKVNEKFYDFDIIILNNKFDILKTFLPFDSNKFETIRLNTSKPFSNLDTLYLFNDFISDTIYSISDSSIKPYKYFSYQGKTLTEKYKLSSHELILNDLKNNFEKFNELDYFANLKGLNNNKIIFYFDHKGKESIFSFFSSTTKNIINYKFPKEYNSQEYRKFLEIQSVENEKFISITYPITLKFLKSQYLIHNNKDKFTKKIDDILKNTEPDGNQIIIKFNIKDF